MRRRGKQTRRNTEFDERLPAMRQDESLVVAFLTEEDSRA